MTRLAHGGARLDRRRLARHQPRVAVRRRASIRRARRDASPPSASRPTARRSSTNRRAGRSTRRPACVTRRCSRRVAWRGERGPSVEARVQGFSERRANGTPLQDNDTNQRQAACAARATWSAAPGRRPASARSQTYDQAFTARQRRPAPPRALTQRQRVPSETAGGSADWLRALGQGDAARRRRSAPGRWQDDRDALRRRQPQAPTTAGGRQRTARRLLAGDAWRHSGADGGRRRPRRSLDRAQRRHRRDARSRASERARRGDVARLRRRVDARHRLSRLPRADAQRALRNFRAGDTLTQANEQLVAETLTGGEVSWLLAHGALSCARTAFVTTLDDAIANVTLTVTPTLTTRQRQNAGSVGSRGARDRGRLAPRRRWSVTGNVTATRATLRRRRPCRARRPRACRRCRAIRRRVGVRFTDPRWLTATLQMRAIGRQFEDDRNTLVLDARHHRRSVRQPQHHAQPARVRGVENLFDEVVPVGRTPLPTIGLPRTCAVGVRVFWP